MKKNEEEIFSRRELLKIGAIGAAGIASATALGKAQDGAQPENPDNLSTRNGVTKSHVLHSENGTVGRVDHTANGFDPSEMLYDFDYGTTRILDTGQTLRQFRIEAIDKEIEIAPGVFFPAWTYNGRIPGPTLRCIEGERISVDFINNGSHPHTIHFHGIHGASMDGVPGVGVGSIAPQSSFRYEFDAFPFGCHLYHCHSLPLKRHIHKGLYGGFIIDPDPNKYQGAERDVAVSRNSDYQENQTVNEMVMVMNGFDTNFDGDNEIYAANSIAFAYMNEPIQIQHDQLQRLYLINITEFDPINSFHLHGNFFDYYDHGTTLTPTLKTVDTIMQCQAQRGILEFSFKDFEEGLYMFHAHQSEFAELGWMGFFDVKA
jgi:FtsP/CotA-like multicopper oxidase with cupredoxin domain